MIKGLYHELAEGNLALTRLKDEQADSSYSPHDRHRAAWAGEILQTRLVDLEKMIHEDLVMVREIQGVLKLLHVSQKSRHRALVITGLEDAQSRLLRELGDKPE